MTAETDQRQLVAEFLDAVSDLSNEEVGARVPGVNRNDASRWRRGDWKRLTAEKKRALHAYLQARREGDQAVELVGTVDNVIRYLGGIGPGGEARARKLDALNALRLALSVKGPVPDWWYRLRDQVENEEL